MKRLLALAVVLAAAFAGLYLAQRARHSDSVSPATVLDAVADAQRDLSRVPMRLTRLPDDEEIRIGDQFAGHYLSFEPSHTAEQQAVEQYVAQVGSRLAARAERRLPFRFHLIASPDLVNAFALPGGHVFIGMGLLRQMNSEDELAIVLGHEIEHIDHRHPAERMQIEAQLKKLNLDSLAAPALLPLAIWQAGYSKEQELEADREGVRLAVLVGYAPQAGLNFFAHQQQLQRQVDAGARTPADELSQLAIEGLRGYFRSHPLPEERLRQINRIIAQDRLDARRPLQPLQMPTLPDNNPAGGNPPAVKPSTGKPSTL